MAAGASSGRTTTSDHRYGVRDAAVAVERGMVRLRTRWQSGRRHGCGSRLRRACRRQGDTAARLSPTARAAASTSHFAQARPLA
eukprot:5615872-Prymnesium_polylepis.1